MALLSRPVCDSKGVVELSDEQLECVSGGFLNWFIPVILIAYAIKKGNPVNVTLPAPTFPPPTGGGGGRGMSAFEQVNLV